MTEFLFRQPTALRVQAPQSAQSGINPMAPQNTLAPLPENSALIRDGIRFPSIRFRIAELEMLVACLSAAVDTSDRERDAALLRMEAAIATSHGLIDAEVQRRTAKAEACDNSTPQNPRPDGSYGTPQHDPEAPGKPPPPRSFPSRALRHQRQSGGLLSTADSGRVRLGGYAPTLPPR